MFKKKCMYIAGAMVLAASLFTGSAFAASSKFAAEVSELTLIDDSNADGTTTILNANLHVGNKKDLLIGVSLETALYTRTEVKGKKGQQDSADAEAGLTVKVIVDEVLDGHHVDIVPAAVARIRPDVVNEGSVDPWTLHLQNHDASACAPFPRPQR